MVAEFAFTHIVFDDVKAEFERSGRNQSRVKHYWVDKVGHPLGAQYKCQIAFHIACTKTNTEPSDFYRRIVAQHDVIGPTAAPHRRGGTASTVGNKKVRIYDADTYRGWMTGKDKITPWEKDLEACVEVVLLAADELLAPLLKPGKTLHGLLKEFEGRARDAFSQAAALLKDMGKARDWRWIPSHIYSPMPTGHQKGLASSNFDACYEQVKAGVHAKQAVKIVGPHYSGKNTLLRKFVTDHAKTGVFISSGSYLTLCALSLYETSAREAISYIANFYAEALGVRSTGETASEQIAEIGHFARQFPAMIVIAGLDTIDSDEIVRALHQDLLGEMVSRILAGHGETRLLVSSSSRDLDRLHRLAPAGETKRTIAFGETVDLSDPLMPPGNYEYFAVKECAVALGNAERGWSEQALAAEIGQLLFGDDALRRHAVSPATTAALATKVAGKLLSAQERFCLGLVGLTHDGLRPPTIVAIVKALRGLLPATFAKLDPIRVLDALPGALLRKPAPGPTRDSGCYRIERAMRDPLLANWLNKAPTQFRVAAWGIARAAASDARRLRMREGLEVSAGRDVQVLILLLASANPANLAGPEGKPPRAEQAILPSLDQAGAAMPSPRAIIDFAFRTLFAQDLARAAERGLHVVDDVQLRLAAVFPFLNNREPWVEHVAELDAADWKPARNRSPWMHLELTERLHLLAFATAAAARRNLRSLITMFARLAEKAAQGAKLTPEQFGHLSRIQRYELDLAILLGHNPDRPNTAKRAKSQAGLKGVQARAETLTGRIPEHLRSERVGQREFAILCARKAEILHLMGRHVEAFWEFHAASLLEIAGETPCAETGTLSGRSRRMYTRLLVELARARLIRTFAYKDGLVLPTIRRSDMTPAPLIKAERVVEESLRGLSRGSVNDWIGLKIDQSRIAALQLRYAQAMEMLDQARKAVLAPGASLDVLLEYLTVRGRTLADAAAFAMSAGARSPHRAGPFEAELQDLAAYVDLDVSVHAASDWRRASAISQALFALATDSLAALKEHAALNDRIETRHAIFADYLEVWIAVVRSRQRVEAEDSAVVAAAVRTQLVSAGDMFSKVLGRMVALDYLLYHREARLLARALAKIDVPVTVPASLPDRRSNHDRTQNLTGKESKWSRSLAAAFRRTTPPGHF